MDYDSWIEVIIYMNLRVRGWWRWGTAEPWAPEKVEAYYCYLVGVED